MQEDYKILGVSENATDEEVKQAYETLKAKYSKDRFLEGEAGNEAARNLTKVEMAYNEIVSERSAFSKDNSESRSYSKISELIRDGKLNEAQDELDNDSNRDAEWHYLQSVIFYKKNWTSESKKQLELAVSLDPDNKKYKDALEKFGGKKTSSDKQFHSGNAKFNDVNNRQMGGETCGNIADCCTTWCLMETLCNCCCR